MSRRSLRWTGCAIAALSLAALLLSGTPIGGTLALFNGETQNAGSSFAGGWIGAATGPSSSVSGYDAAFAWTPGSHGPVTGQQLWGVDNTTNSNCTGAAYASFATMALATTNSYTDASRGTAANDGNWFCYEIVSTSATVWTALAPLPAFQIGLVANGVSIANANIAGRIEKNDTITITFNQRTNLGTANIRVCVWSTGSIVLGDTSGGCNSSADGYSLGRLTVSGATIPSNLGFNSSPVALRTTAPWTITITLAGTNNNATMSGSPTWTFTPGAGILSFATTHQATICSAAKTTCQPTTTSNF